MEQFNSFAISVLMGLSSILGIHSLPSSDTSWEVTAPWKHESGVSQAILSSQSIIEECRKSPRSFIDFPVIIDGAQEVFLDSRKIISFGDPVSRTSRSFFGSPVLRCSEVLDGSLLTWKAYAYTHYFARIHFFPRVVEKEPIRNFFNETLQIIAAGSLVFIALFSLVVSIKTLPISIIITFFVSNICLSAYFYFSVASLFGNHASVMITNRIADLTVWIGLLLFLNILEYLKIIPRYLNLFCRIVISLGLFIILLGKHVDTLQFGTFLPFLTVFLTLIYGFIGQLLSLLRRESSEKLLFAKTGALGLWIVSILNDMFVITGGVDGYILMEVGAIGSVLFFAFILNDEVFGIYRERDYLRLNLEAEVRTKTEQLSEKNKVLENTLGDLKSVRDEILNLTSQVAHDIRSPLTALKMISQDLFELPEDKRTLLKAVIHRVNDIANTLAYGSLGRANEKHVKTSPGSTQTILLSALVDKVVTEKRLQYRLKMKIEINPNLTKDSYGLFVNVDEIELSRMISNVISNAVESISVQGRVTVSLESKNQSASIIIRDNGKGISSDILPNLCKRGVTFEKPGGSGLGLFHAQTSLSRWNGKLHIDSKLGVGTSVILEIPLANPPEWFVESIDTQDIKNMVVVDDDINIHKIWEKRMSEQFGNKLSPQLFHLLAPAQLKEWLKQTDHISNTIFLVDYEFMNEKWTGLTLIQELDIASRSCLVTSRYEEREIQESCSRLGIKLIPKGMAGFVPILSGGNQYEC